MSRLDLSQRAAVKSFLREASSYSTAYSGAGMFEYIVFALAVHLGVQPPRCSHGWEVDATARQSLLASAPGSGPGPDHVFGDLMGVWPKRVITKLKRVQRVLLREHKRMVLAGHWVHASGVLTKGMEYLQAVDGMLSQHSPARTAWCYRHRRFCEVPRPPLSEGLHFRCAGPHVWIFPGALRLSCSYSGFTCLYSPAGDGVEACITNL